MILIKKLGRLTPITVKEKVYRFLKRNKKYAFRPTELTEKIGALDSTVRDGLLKLHREGKVSKKVVSYHCTYYYYKK